MTRHMKLERTRRVTGVLTWSIIVEREIPVDNDDKAIEIFEKMHDNGEFGDSFTSRKQPRMPELNDVEVEMLEGIA